MKFTDIFIRRPVLAIAVNLVIIIAGLQAIRSLNVRQYPETENASITVSTVYIGADADLVRGFITVPLERAIAAADGIDFLQSTSSRGLSTITARLDLDYDATRALSEISSKVDQVRGDLPPEAEVPIINIESADSQFASAYLSFTSDILEQNQITDYLLRAVQPRLAALPGVQRAEILGARNFAMRVWLQPDKMAAYNVSPAEVREALLANNYLSAIGQTKGTMIQVNLTANTDLRSVEGFRKLAIRERDGALVRLEDIAEVSLGAEDYSAEVRFTGQTATFMGIFVLPDANSIDVIESVREEMVDITDNLPTGLEGRIAYDATDYINNAISEVIKTLTETLIIVGIVIFLFLGSIRSVIVPLLAIPLSLIGAVFLMQVFGFTINLLTLLAIVLSVGLVVDDAIVMVENIERNLRKGYSPFDAAIVGARELRGPIISMTITLAAVYAPIGFAGGLTGSLFQEFAFTLAGAVLLSGIVALTLSPVVSSWLLKEETENRGLPRLINGGFERLKRIYAWVLDSALAVRPAIYIVWIGCTVLGLGMFYFASMGKELAPTEDQGVVFTILDTPANSSLEVTSAAAEAVNDIFFSIPETRFSFQFTTPGGGFSGMVVAPWGERERSIFPIHQEVQGKLADVAPVDLFAITPAALPGGSNFAFEFVISSTAQPEEILEYAQELQGIAAQSGMFAFPPTIDTKIDQPVSEIVIDREKVASMGLNMRSVGADLGSMLGGGYVNRFNIEGYSYKVIPQVERVERLNPEQLENIYVTGPGGQLIPLSTIATIETKVQPRALNRMQQLNAVTLSGVPIRPLNQALAFMEEEAAKILPEGYVLDYRGESRQLRNDTGASFVAMMGLALALIYLVLAAQFNSFRDPFIIVFGSFPLAMFGASIFMFLKMPNPNLAFWTDGWTTSVNIYSQVGLVTLIGLVSKNGILIVEFANELQRQGHSKLVAVREAALVRLRPILMTTAATVFGHMPLVFVTGAGAEARNSIGLVLVTGMAIGTLFTLFVIPGIYTFFASDHSKEDSRLASSKVIPQKVEAVQGAGI